MKRVATIILNRNLPVATDALCQHIRQFDSEHTEIFVLEAGSDKNNLSQNATWYIDDPVTMKNGLRYGRGMNQALLELYQSDRWHQFDAFFLLTNDTELESGSTIGSLLKILDHHRRVGILSPCSKSWGERLLLKEQTTKYFWFIHNHALFLRREFLEAILNFSEPNNLDFVFDGSNFRGYLSESELIAKAYSNDWAAAITSEVTVEENESYLVEKSDLIKTEPFEENLKLYIREGEQWMRRKYGFNSRWAMQQYVKSFYDRFFEFHPELAEYSL